MCEISVITSVYNTEQYLRKSIESVLNQSFGCFEYIIINNGSTDNSYSIIEEYSKIDKRIKVINNISNKMLSEARNQGINISTGKYIYFIDSDDYIDSNALEIAYNEIEKNNVDLIVFGWKMEYYFDNDFVSFPVVPKRNILSSKDELRNNIMNYLKQSILTVPWNKLYKSSIIKNNDVRFPNTKLEDHHFNMEYIKDISSVQFIDKPLYHYYRSRPGSELNDVYRFDLFNKKKEHYLHTKKILNYWEITDKKNINILYTFFGERVIQCVQEIVANNNFSKKEKVEKIRIIFKDSDVKESLKKGHYDSFIMKLLILPIKLRIMWLSILEAKYITWYKIKNNKKFIKKRAKLVNHSKQEV